MLENSAGWVSHNGHFLLAGTANGFAWAQSISTGNLSVGAVVTVCTVAVPAVGGAVIYLIKTVGPVWLQFRESLDALRSKSMAGQMASLIQTLKDNVARMESQERLKALADQRAEIADQNAVKLTAMVVDLNVKVDKANQVAAQANQRIEDANAKLHEQGRAAQAAIARATIAEEDAKVIQRKLDEALAQLGQNARKADDNQAKIAAVSNKVDDFAKFGAAMADAADVLVHPRDDQTPDHL